MGLWGRLNGLFSIARVMVAGGVVALGLGVTLAAAR